MGDFFANGGKGTLEEGLSFPYKYLEIPIGLWDLSPFVNSIEDFGYSHYGLPPDGNNLQTFVSGLYFKWRVETIAFASYCQIIFAANEPGNMDLPIQQIRIKIVCAVEI